MLRVNAMHQSILQLVTTERRGQKQDLLDYLDQHGSVTRFQAALELGIMELSSRIGELEKDGWIVPREWQRGEARNGRKYAVMRYRTPYKANDT